MSFAAWIDKHGDPAANGSWGGRKVPWSDCCRAPIGDGADAWLAHLNTEHAPGDRAGGQFLVTWYRSTLEPDPPPTLADGK